MAGGRPRKPQRLKVLAGESRPSRLGPPEPQPLEAEPTAPEWLSEPARAEWERVSGQLRGMRLLFAADRDVIASYAAAVALLAECERNLAEQGWVDTDRDGQPRRNPWALHRRQALDELHRAGSALGLTPQARTRLDATPPTRPTDDDELAARLLS